MKNNIIAIVVIVVLLAGGGGFFAGMKYQQSKSPRFGNFQINPTFRGMPNDESPRN